MESSARPVTPSPAATLVLLRDGASGAVEALLLQRHGKSKFAAGDHVFAGGKVEAEHSAEPEGLGADKMTAEQQALLRQLLDEIVGDSIDRAGGWSFRSA
jgi:8-oxo-dGTP pyrophosphatase MutT (NUDIX family)